jgi:L-lactate dehydrogenase (cytochrome)
MKTMTCIEDLRQAARRRVPRMFFDYAESGSYAEQTLHANRADLAAVRLRQRILVDVASRSTGTTILGEKVSLPLALAPIGLCGMQHGDGEILACRAAQAAGIPFTLSTMSVCSIEDVAAAVDKPFWFQLYVIKDRGFIRELIARAKAAKCSALVLTVDLQILGQRHRDIKNGLTVPPEWRVGNIIDIASKPAWLFSIARSKHRTFGNLSGYVPGMKDVSSLSKWTAEQFDPAMNWKDVESRRPSARRRALVGLGPPEDRRRCRLVARSAVRWRHPLRPGHHARRRTRCPRLPLGARLHLRPWCRRRGWRRPRHRDHT